MASDPRIKLLPDVKTELLFDIVINLAPKVDFGVGPLGRRVLYGSAGGTFEGPQLRGAVMPGGGDRTLFRTDGVVDAGCAFDASNAR